MNDENNGGVVLTPEQIAELKTERDNAIAAQKKLTEDLLYEKKKKQEAEEKLKALPVTEPTEFEKIVEAKLRERDVEDFKVAQEDAVKEFLSENKEYDPSVDTTGLRMEALKREVSRFNLSGARKKEDFLSAFKDAAMLINRKESKEVERPYASAPQHSGGAPIVTDEASLSSTERATMKRLGWNLEKFNTMKLKHADLFGSLFK